MNKHYDRYSGFRSDNGFKSIPFIKIPKLSTDKKKIMGKYTRLDKISNEYYGSPYFSWLILQANPEIASIEFDIKENTIIRLPFPLNSSIDGYIEKVKEHKRLYG